jgi:hydroxymethylpyrimidine pyrophosphatase-like HAD family hydrolase
VDIWLHTEKDWFALNSSGPYVDHEIRTIQTAPKVLASFDRPGVIDHAYKIVGVSKDFDFLARCERELAAALGTSATVARSQLYYLDVTHPLANKGHAVERLSQLLDVPISAIATIGDGRNDMAMFAVSGLAVAMGNADGEVQKATEFVSASNEEDGFALAVERWILPRAAARGVVAAATQDGAP